MIKIDNYTNLNLISLFIFFILGLLIRLYLIEMPGTIDLMFWSTFLEALDKFNNVSFLYIPGVENIQNFRDYNLPVMYPPGFVYILFFFNKINNFLFQLEYNYLFKSILIFFDLIVVLVLSYIYNNKIKEIIFFFWLNPVIFLCGSALGYIDIIPYSFLLFSILLILNQKFILSSMFFIASCSVKQLGLIVLPIYFIYFLKKKNLSYNLKLFVFLFLLIVLGFFPVLFSATNFSIFQTAYGFIKNMYWGLLTDYISGQGLNIWWVYSASIELLNNWSVDKTFISNISEIRFELLRSESGIWSWPQFIGRIFIIIFTFINIIKIYQYPDKLVFLKTLIFQYFAYCIFATGVHENHGILLAGLSSILILIDSKKYFNFCLLINLYVVSNLVLFYGIDGSINVRNISGWSFITLIPTIFIIFYFLYNYRKYIKNIF